MPKNVHLQAIRCLVKLERKQRLADVAAQPNRGRVAESIVVPSIATPPSELRTSAYIRLGSTQIPLGNEVQTLSKGGGGRHFDRSQHPLGGFVRPLARQ